jgi:hypothetical protein
LKETIFSQDAGDGSTVTGIDGQTNNRANARRCLAGNSISTQSISQMKQVVLIILLCIGLAIVYGIVHDQITIRICVEYFTIGHPRVFQTDSITVLALGWGLIASWWVGLIIGVPLAIAARVGNRPRRSAHSLIRPMLILLVVMGASAVLAGFIGNYLAEKGSVVLLDPLWTEVPEQRHVAFLTDLWAHSASYIVGFVGGVVLIAKTWRDRGRIR